VTESVRPLISVVVAVRNAQSTIARTLDSLQSQSFLDFEVVVADGASTDDTVNIVRRYGKLITSLVSEPDGGIADAWNKAVARTRGDFIIFLNAGDLLHPDHFLRASAKLVGRDQQCLFYCDVIKFNAANEITTVIRGRNPSSVGIRRGGIGFAHPGSFTPGDAFKHIGPFDTQLKIAIDTDFLLRCEKSGYRFQKFTSCAYMAEGGVSDVKFGRAMQEYYLCAHRLNFVTQAEAYCYARLMPAARVVLHGLRHWCRPPLRTFKHALVAVANAAPQLLPFAWTRRLYFSLMGFSTGSGVSLGMGLQFYTHGRVALGDHSVINRDCLLDNRGDITIGHNVSIARNVSIFTAGHDPDSPLFEMVIAPVRIGNHVVVFARCIILPGVTIGDGAVVYAGSVVTKDVAPLTIVGGTPAQVIRERRLPQPVYGLNYPYPMAM
jgi:acetyltransferase-like isoleucine patch superfamily enzyme